MTEEEKTEPLNKETKTFLLIAAAALFAILFVILFGFNGKPAPTKLNTTEYNYYTFEQVGGLWQTTVKLDDKTYIAVFRFNPAQVKDVYVTGNFTGFKTEPIYVTFDPDADPTQFKYLALASTELGLNVIRALNFSMQSACTKNLTDACKDRPIITCDTPNASVIYLNPVPPTQITLTNHCVTLTGEGMDIMRSADRLLFQWYKIMHATDL